MTSFEINLNYCARCNSPLVKHEKPALPPFKLFTYGCDFVDKTDYSKVCECESPVSLLKFYTISSAVDYHKLMHYSMVNADFTSHRVPLFNTSIGSDDATQATKKFNRQIQMMTDDKVWIVEHPSYWMTPKKFTQMRVDPSAKTLIDILKLNKGWLPIQSVDFSSTFEDWDCWRDAGMPFGAIVESERPKEFVDLDDIMRLLSLNLNDFVKLYQHNPIIPARICRLLKTTSL